MERQSEYFLDYPFILRERYKQKVINAGLSTVLAMVRVIGEFSRHELERNANIYDSESPSD